jgi:hypothetical protein
MMKHHIGILSSWIAKMFALLVSWVRSYLCNAEEDSAHRIGPWAIHLAFGSLNKEYYSAIKYRTIGVLEMMKETFLNTALKCTVLREMMHQSTTITTIDLLICIRI